MSESTQLTLIQVINQKQLLSKTNQNVKEL